MLGAPKAVNIVFTVLDPTGRYRLGPTQQTVRKHLGEMFLLQVSRIQA